MNRKVIAVTVLAGLFAVGSATTSAAEAQSTVVAKGDPAGSLRTPSLNGQTSDRGSSLVATNEPVLRERRLDCVYSPTRREWELDRGGKQCRKKALRFIRVTRSFAGYQPALSGCATTKPKRVWRCTATEFRTTNIEKGNIVAGRFVKVGRAWVVRGLRFPEPDF